MVTSAGAANVTSYVVTICRLPATFAFNSATDVPVTANDCLPAGNIAAFALNVAPIPGTHLMVVKNTGTNPIQGTFDNLAQGQSVTLTYNGVAYSFVANYSGGTGNDLVLQWKNTRLLAWGGGYTYYGQLGNGSSASSPLPVPVDMSGVLAGKTVMAIASGSSHSLALCADGTLATWGYNYYGQLGNKSTNNSSVPVLVDRTGVLAGKTVVRIATGNNNCLVLCSDGTLAAWGDNWSGALGNNSTTSSSVPVLVDMSGVLAGKSVSAIAAGNHTYLALCADGNIATWGWNDYGQLGNNNIISSSVPVLVDRTGVLAGKTVTVIASENTHNLALCSDGTVAAWGYNNYGQLGNNSTTNSSVPVAVTQTGVLASKTVLAIAAGDSHSLALCADGTLAAWGYNNYGQLGNNSSTNSSVPVLVTQTGVLAGKTVVGATAGDSHSIALCSDGSLAAWGYNAYGQLGNNSISNSSVPVTVNPSNLGVGERAMALSAGAGQCVALFASPPPPVVATLSASGILDTSATLNSTVNAQGTATAVSFEYGLTTTYGSTVAASPTSLGSIITTPASAAITGLSSGTTYHYRIVATGGSTARGDDMTFTTTTFAALSGLNLSDGILSPAFATSTTNYLATVPFAVETLTLTPLVATPGATVTIDGLPVDPGTASGPLDLTIGETRIDIGVTAPGGSISQTYSVTVTRMPEFFAFNAATDVPLTVSGFAATGNAPTFTLNYAPVPGTSLLVVQNTGSGVIQGTFENLTRGQVVNLTYGGVIYPFVADYAGGTGNDLVLRWGNTKPVLWGDNAYGQLGIGSTVSSSVAVPLTTTGVLAGKMVIAMATGDASNHSFARCADGTLAGWGDGYSNVPGLGPQTGGLAGKTVAAVAVGMSHNLALCTDGTLAAWGDNRYGQLGNNTTSNSSVPVLVDRTGTLAGKTVIAIAAGYWHCLVLCSDGTLATWGYNANSQLGTGTTADSKVPAAVIQSGVLAGKSVIAISSGSSHNLALSSDGSIAAWGYNSSGQLGNNSTTTSSAPVLVDRSGVLAGKTATAIAAGDTHSMVMCSDGSLVTWGYNSYGQLGNNNTTSSNVPVAVTQTGVLAGKTVTAITAGRSHNLALCADGTLAAWGYNASGQLGNNSLTNSSVPVRVGTGGPGTGERFVTIGAGYGHSLAILAQPPPPVASTVAATAIDDAGATLNVGVSPNGSTTNVSFEFGLTTSYGSTVTATPWSLTGSASAAASATIGGLLPGTVYHYRAVASSAYGTSKGEDMTFTTSSFSALADLVLSNGTLDPVFVRSRAGYLATVPFAADNLVVTPIAADGTPTVTVNGVSVQVGTPSNPLPLSPGENVISVGVTAEDGKMSRTYTVTVTRLPASFVFNSPSDVPVSVGDFTGVGNTASIALNFAPTPGTILTVVNSTGGLIRNPFSNLAHGQLLPLTYNGITYSFLANYYGGSGNDLVLQWANTRVLAWGSNAKGQLGNGTTSSSTVPVAIDASGILAGESVIGLAAGMTGFSEYGHSLALCADGTVAAWGTGSTLGNNSTTDSPVPVWVDRTGVLSGKTVAAVSIGSGFSLALCSDGTLAGWGYNSYGQLGNNSSTSTQVPVAVLMSGVLAGKAVVALATGNSHGLALCADGTLAAWGYNASGQLGNNSKVNSSVPVLVDQTGVLAGKKVVAISAGEASNLVLCSDGTLAAWGSNGSGQLGNNSMTNSLMPVLVDRSGVLAGKTVVKIASGNWHNLALCSDGTLTAWGNNGWGALGDNSGGSSPVPVWVDQTGVLAGKTIVAISAARIGSLATCSDGTLATWGQNSYGQLGNNSKTDSNIPVRVNTSALRNGERFMLGISGSTSGDHTLALVASPLPTAVTQPALILTHTDATLNGSVNANGNATTVSFEYGLDATYGNSTTAIPAAVSGSSDTQVSMNLGGLIANTTYHFRVLATCNGAVVRGSDMTFIPSNPPVFAGYSISTPFQTAANVALKKLLAKASDPEGTACSVTLAGPASANGGTAVLQTSGILYTPPAGFSGSDTFLVTITDANGAATSGTVTATVGPAAAAGGATTNPPQITVLDGGQIRLKFHGIAGRSYQIQRSTDLATWATIATASADSIGAMSFTDTTPPQPNAYYRLALP
ncbi:MAG: cadherin-like beta sandwich domain-containing protein [Verrucomicrobiota bacterium]